MVSFSNLKRTIIMVVTLCVVMNLTACKKKSASIAFNLESEPVTLDPQIASDYSSNLIIMNLFEGLTRIDENGNAVEGVAESWETNENKTRYVFHLRKDAVWSDKDSSRVTANDFVFAVKRAISKGTMSSRVSDLYCIKNAQLINQSDGDISTLGISAHDDYTLVFDLESSYEKFPVIVARAPFMPCHEKFFDKCDGSYGRDAKSLVCNGPFRLSGDGAWSEKSISLVKNEKYFGIHNPDCNYLNFTFGDELKSPVDLLEREKYSILRVTPDDARLAKEKGFCVNFQEDEVWGIAFNLSNESDFNDTSVRKTLLAAIDRDYVLSEAFSYCNKTSNIIMSDSDVDGQNYRKEVGDIGGVGFAGQEAVGMLQGKKIPNFTLKCRESEKVIVSKVLECWNKNLGGYFNMKPLDISKYGQVIDCADYNAILCPLKPDGSTPQDFLKKFKSDSKENMCCMSDGKYDSLVNDIESKKDVNLKINAILIAEKYLLENGVFYPLYTSGKIFAINPKISGVIFHPYDVGVDFTNVKFG